MVELLNQNTLTNLSKEPEDAKNKPTTINFEQYLNLEAHLAGWKT